MTRAAGPLKLELCGQGPGSSTGWGPPSPRLSSLNLRERCVLRRKHFWASFLKKLFYCLYCSQMFTMS